MLGHLLLHSSNHKGGSGGNAFLFIAVFVKGQNEGKCLPIGIVVFIQSER